jgi:hypothetical protein
MGAQVPGPCRWKNDMLKLVSFAHTWVEMPNMQVLDWLLGRIIGAVVDKQMHLAGGNVTSRGCNSDAALPRCLVCRQPAGI